MNPKQPQPKKTAYESPIPLLCCECGCNVPKQKDWDAMVAVYRAHKCKKRMSAA